MMEKPEEIHDQKMKQVDIHQNCKDFSTLPILKPEQELETKSIELAQVKIETDIDKCYLCLEEFNKFELELHFTQRHPEIPHDRKLQKCEFFEKLFSHIGHLQAHVSQVHAGEKNYSCLFCEQTFGSKQTLSQHISHIHENKKENKCDICGLAFNVENALKKHINALHQTSKVFQCNQCKIILSSETCLQKHVKNVHEKLYHVKCEFCDKSYNKNDLKIHVKATHHITTLKTLSVALVIFHLHIHNH